MGLGEAVAQPLWGGTGLAGSGLKSLPDLYIGNPLCIFSMLLLANNHKKVSVEQAGEIWLMQRIREHRGGFLLPSFLLLKGESCSE
jgi:hypothetical protein